MGHLAMDSELSRKISGIVAELAEAEQARLQAAGTFVELEELACEIGDEVTRQLMGGELADRGNAAASDTALCPDCGECCHQNEAPPRRLTSSRGEVSYHEPTFYCRDCRRSFFPSGRSDGAAHASYGDTQSQPGDGLGGQQPK